jgi:hypothetical protein
MHWSKTIIEEILKEPSDSSYEVHRRMMRKHQSWLEYWKPYSELTEDVKEHDRKWAYKVAKIVREHQVQEEIKDNYDAKKHSEMY